MNGINIIILIGSICSAILTISGFLVAFVKPIRKKFWDYVRLHNSKDEALLCSLRNDMTNVYNKYSDLDSINISEYDWESFMSTYACYHSLGGNLYVDSMFEKIRNWNISFPSKTPDASYYETLKKLQNAGIELNKKNIK